MISNVIAPIYFKGNEKQRNVRNDFDANVQKNNQLRQTNGSPKTDSNAPAKAPNNSITMKGINASETAGKKLNLLA